MTAAAQYPDLDGAAVVITGGASGIGAGLVEAFAAQGARVGFLDIQAERGEALAARLGPRVVFAPCDLTDVAALGHALDAVSGQIGAPRILINNAANDARHALAELTPEGFDAGVAINLRPALFAIQRLAPAMRRAGRGSIINFGSIGWKKYDGGYPVYAAMKAAAHGLTRTLAREMGAAGVRVNTLTPGWVMTEKQVALWVDDAARDAIARGQCLPGELSPEHIAEAALFLASDASRMITGQELIVDGGWV
ncbi:MAG: SDR family oxidoreductase [Pseudomonadota bacterium]